MIERRANGALPHEQPRRGVRRERALADEIISVLTFAGPRVCSTAEATIRYTVRGT